MTQAGQFAIAIPNYNYDQYLQETITSAVEQRPYVREIHVSDNCSTDGSREIVRSFDESLVSLSVNRRNVGFAANLDRAVLGTFAPFVILLSSDDLVKTGALEVYDSVLGHLGGRAASCVVTSSVELINGAGMPFGRHGPREETWSAADIDEEMSAFLGFRVLSASGAELLRRSLLSMRCPIPFCSTAYPRDLYDVIEGYGGGRLINPDKWFNWKLCSVADRVYFLDKTLFSYRVHDQNQGSLQRSTGALKHMVDQYVSTLEVDDQMLAAAGLDRQNVVDAFLRNDVVERGFAALLDGDTGKARRLVHFGKAVYPAESRRSFALTLLSITLATGPFGAAVARRASRFTPMLKRWGR